ncbi:MAG: GntR family transcriptional regulator, partial [Spirochaetes bacterium]|nr:GntR family transcriptional regulator [Spirochaetota bacterium]
KIDKNIDVPSYRQLIEQLIKLVQEKKLSPGDKLPAERELAEKLGIARGTIKKAYEELLRLDMVEAVQGKGTFVSLKQNIIHSSRMEQALSIINQTLVQLQDLDFSLQEISNLIDIKIMEREEILDNLHIAAIDCNPEALDIYENQLLFISRVKIRKYLLDNLARDTSLEKTFNHYALILTTSNHYQELKLLLPNEEDKLIQLAVSPSQSTIIQLASISNQKKIGILCESEKFYRIIHHHLENLNFISANIEVSFFNHKMNNDQFIAQQDILIIPPGYSFDQLVDQTSVFQQFRQKGGKIIRFDYQIERGSLLYIEERIKQLKNQT